MPVRGIVLKYPAMRLKLLISLLFVCASVSMVHAQGETGDIFARVNNLRASVGRAPYNLNSALSAAAQSQAQWIVDTGNVSHTHPDGSGPRTRALNAGYPSTQVSENIYGGTNASVDSAWTFWMNSGIHYAGMVNASYNDVGVGAAHGSWGAAYVLVFGNSGGPPPPPQSAGSNNASTGSNSGNSAAAAPPSYVVGLDENGNIMHQVQPGDTLGDIALIYGYTWDDLPEMMALNGLNDVHDLEVGSIFLVPSKNQPRVANAPTTEDTVTERSAPIVTATPIPATITPFVALMPVREATLVVTPLAEPTQTAAPVAIATADGSIPAFLNAPMTATPSTAQATAQGTQVAMVPTGVLQEQSTAATPPATRSNSSLWIVIAVAVQVFVLAVAGVEFLRRARRGRR